MSEVAGFKKASELVKEAKDATPKLKEEKIGAIIVIIPNYKIDFRLAIEEKTAYRIFKTIMRIIGQSSRQRSYSR